MANVQPGQRIYTMAFRNVQGKRTAVLIEIPLRHAGEKTIQIDRRPLTSSASGEGLDHACGWRSKFRRTALHLNGLAWTPAAALQLAIDRMDRRRRELAEEVEELDTDLHALKAAAERMANPGPEK